MSLESIRETYGLVAGSWSGCDWPTRFGKTGLNLQGWTSCQAKCMAADAQPADAVLAKDWEAAARWLADVEEQAEQAEVQAAIALAAASAGQFAEALEHAQRARELEEAAGRPADQPGRRSWTQLVHAIEHVTTAAAKGKATKLPDSGNRVEATLARLEAEQQKLRKRIEQLERAGVLV